MSYIAEHSSNQSGVDYAVQLAKASQDHGEGKYNRTLFIGLGG
jgi:hypothetical protein